MTDLEVFALVSIAMALCFANWRVGVLICIFVGFIQDPLRKVMPGEPVFFTVLVGAPLLATLIGAHQRKIRLSFQPLHAWNDVLRKPLKVFVLLVLLQSCAALIRTGSLIVAGIGALSYLAPLPAILLGYQFARTDRDIGKAIKVYLVLSVVMVLGVYLAYEGYDWTVLRQVGTGLYIYSLERGKLNLYAGFLRSPEIAAWHAAAAACLLMLVALSIRRNMALKWGSGLLIPLLIGAILLTGRRKFLVEIFLFTSIYAFMTIYFRRTGFRSAMLSKSALVVVGGLLVGSVGYMFITPDETTADIRPYYERGLSVSSDLTDRVSVMTFESFQYVIAENGILGSGAGTGSQGVQHFGGQITGGAAEGGLAKVLAELGIPGLLLLIWLTISVGRYLWSIVQYLTTTEDLDPMLSRLAFGLVAFLITNGLVYIIAHQVFGDPFVLIILGLFLGFVLAMPKIVTRRADNPGWTPQEIDRRKMSNDEQADKLPASGYSTPILSRR